MLTIRQSRFATSAQPQTFTGTNPAANTEISETVPAGEYWYVLSVTVALAQAGAGSSFPVLTVSDGSSVFFQSYGATAAQAISTTCQYTWARGLTLSAIVGATTACKAIAPLPFDLYLPAGCVIATATVGLSANTDYGAPIIRYVKGTG